jgi:hypothetical protein
MAQTSTENFYPDTGTMLTERTWIKRDYFESFVGKELFDLTCGNVLGEGIGRLVLEYLPDPTCVVKLQLYKGFQNVQEWELWKDLCDYEPSARFLAPCVSISQCGQWLLQKRTDPIPRGHEMPKTLPRFLTDISYKNFGLYQGRVVCHDYALHLCCNYARDKMRRKVDWFRQ